MRKKLKMSTVKKELRNGLRVDNTYSNLLRQFNLSGGVAKKGHEKGRFRVSPRPSSILYVCLVLGISIGIGSAFADKGIFPSQKPLDQPIQKKAEIKSDTGDHGGTEMIPQDPKQELILEKSTRIANEQKEKADLDSKQGGATKNIQNKSENAEPANASPSQTISKEEKGDMDVGNSGDKNTGKALQKSSAPITPSPFKTEVGGRLPETAGNGGNQFLLGLLLILVGCVLLNSKWVKLR